MLAKCRSTRGTGIITAVLILLATSVASVQAQDIRLVEPTGADTGDCIAEACATIQYAIDQAAAGDTIEVEPGVYAEAIDASVAGLQLSGPNAGTAGADAARGDEATIEGQVVLSADGVVFDGFDISPPDATDNQQAEAVRVSNTPDDVIVRNNIVRDFGEDGLPQWVGVDGINVFGGDGSEAINNVVVSSNLVTRIQGRLTDGGSTGISIQGNVNGAEVTNNQVVDIGQAATAWAFGIVVRGTGNHETDPVDVSITDNSVALPAFVWAARLR